MSKIDRIHSGAACAAPADLTEQAIGPSADRVSDFSQIDGRPGSQRNVDPRRCSPTLTAMPLPQVGWCRILLRS